MDRPERIEFWGVDGNTLTNINEALELPEVNPNSLLEVEMEVLSTDAGRESKIIGCC